MDASLATFDKEVLEASHRMPVLVDFWAPWCGPCRSLSPVLDKIGAEGKVRVVKVNVDENQELAARFNIRSIPDVRAFRDGKEAGGFMGALPERQVRSFIDGLQHGARIDAAAALIGARKYDEAEAELAQVPEDPDWDARVQALKQAIAFARSGGSEQELEARVAANPADLEARLAYAGALASRKLWREAMDQLLEIIRRDKEWNDGEARKQLLAIFNLGAGPELVSEYRRKLASALY
jgi:putative thioredoxin